MPILARIPDPPAIVRVSSGDARQRTGFKTVLAGALIWTHRRVIGLSSPGAMRSPIVLFPNDRADVPEGRRSMLTRDTGLALGMAIGSGLIDDPAWRPVAGDLPILVRRHGVKVVARRMGLPVAFVEGWVEGLDGT